MGKCIFSNEATVKAIQTNRKRILGRRNQQLSIFHYDSKDSSIKLICRDCNHRLESEKGEWRKGLPQVIELGSVPGN